MLALAKLRHSGAVAVVRQLRRPSLKRRQTKPTVAPIKTKNPVRADTTHIFSKMAMILLPMPTYTASKNNDRARLRLPSDCRQRGPEILGTGRGRPDPLTARDVSATTMCMSLGAIGLTDSLNSLLPRAPGKTSWQA